MDIARRVTAEALVRSLSGAIAGMTIGALSIRYVEPMVYQVDGHDFGPMALPCVAILAVAFLATLPAILRAVRVNPIAMLRME